MAAACSNQNIDGLHVQWSTLLHNQLEYILESIRLEMQKTLMCCTKFWQTSHLQRGNRWTVCPHPSFHWWSVAGCPSWFAPTSLLWRPGSKNSSTATSHDKVWYCKLIKQQRNITQHICTIMVYISMSFVHLRSIAIICYQAAGVGAKAPIPPVLGPWSLSKARLWSWAGGRTAMRCPSHRAKTEHSGPKSLGTDEEQCYGQWPIKIN